MKKTLLLTAVLIALVFASCGNDKAIETNVTTVDSTVTIVVAPASTGAITVSVDSTSAKKIISNLK